MGGRAWARSPLESCVLSLTVLNDGLKLNLPERRNGIREQFWNPTSKYLARGKKRNKEGVSSLLPCSPCFLPSSVCLWLGGHSAIRAKAHTNRS